MNKLWDGDALSSVIQRAELKISTYFCGSICNIPPIELSPTSAYLYVLRSRSVRVWHWRDGVETVVAPALLFFSTRLGHRLIPESLNQCDAQVFCSIVEFCSSFGRLLYAELSRSILNPVVEAEGLLAIIDALFAEAGAKRDGQHIVLDCLIKVAVIQALRQAIKDSVSKSGVLAGLADPRIGPVLDHLHARPGDDWTLQKMAELAGISRSRFAARFVEVVGQPAGEYLSAWRVSVIQSALLKGRPMKGLADEVGYSSASALTRAFSQVVGMSPSCWLDRVYAEST